MKIAIIGATGFVGSALVEEAVSRKHQVSALVRNVGKVEAKPGVTGVQSDVTDTPTLVGLLAGHDVVISAFNGGWENADIYAKHLAGSRSIAEAAKQAGVRLITVGGAGSLIAPDGSQFVDGPEFPAAYKDGASAARDALNELRSGAGLDWSFVSPPFLLVPGERTGQYRLGLDTPVFNAAGQSTISVADLAVAILDEAETPRHRNHRFTVGY